MKFLIIIFLLFYVPVFSQQKKFYFLRFSDKEGTKYTIEKPEEFLTSHSIKRREKQGIAIDISDLPISEIYENEVKKIHSLILYKSKWLNGVLIQTTEEKYQKIVTLPFIIKEEYPYKIEEIHSVGESSGVLMGNNERTHTEQISLIEDYGNNNKMIQLMKINPLHEDDFWGENISIAIFDTGFPKLTEIAPFQHLVTENKILDTYNFTQTNNTKNVFEDTWDSHGIQVSSLLSTHKIGDFVGIAPKATYSFYITEDIHIESRIEEYFWLFAAERADSLGVDIINSSLGYINFDNEKENYSIEHLTGGFSVITQAADWAAKKGILVVSAVGNNSEKWGNMTMPSDADSILSVGSVNANKTISPFSSYGYTTKGKFKPDVYAWGENIPVVNMDGGMVQKNGTSLSSPIVAGIGALLWQKYPELNNQELIEKIKQFLLHIPTLLEKDVSNKQDVIIYPNPTSHSLQWGKSLHFTLYSMGGREILSGLTENIDINHLPNGAYWICFEGNDCRKIIKQ